MGALFQEASVVEDPRHNGILRCHRIQCLFRCDCANCVVVPLRVRDDVTWILMHRVRLVRIAARPGSNQILCCECRRPLSPGNTWQTKPVVSYAPGTCLTFDVRIQPSSRFLVHTVSHNHDGAHCDQWKEIVIALISINRTKWDMDHMDPPCPATARIFNALVLIAGTLTSGFNSVVLLSSPIVTAPSRMS